MREKEISNARIVTRRLQVELTWWIIELTLTKFIISVNNVIEELLIPIGI